MSSIAKPSCIALIPARAGSLRVASKNIRPLAGHPLLAYSIATARSSGIFDAIIVSTDSEEYAEVARRYGAEVPFLRSPEMSGPRSPDIEWVADLLTRLKDAGRSYDCFSILRPTSPFRRPGTIQRAWKLFLENPRCDSMRAIEKCAQHPGKMWVIREGALLPLLPFSTSQQPWHSTPYQDLPEVYAQNASLEMAWSRVVLETGTIAGTAIVPFITDEYEGFDINNELDWLMAELLLSRGLVKLPEFEQPVAAG